MVEFGGDGGQLGLDVLEVVVDVAVVLTDASAARFVVVFERANCLHLFA